MSVVPPIPLPSGNMQQWAVNIANYLQSLERSLRTPAPKILQLETIMKLDEVSAGTGILAWSAEEGCPVVSYNGAWYKMTLVAV